MSPIPEVSAAAANDAYKNRSPSDVDDRAKLIDLAGHKYTIFGYKSDPVTGFHATAYREVAPPHNIIIAYRGTDPDIKHHGLTTAQDVFVDATMVRDRVNPQAADARAFTQAMIDKAARHGIGKDQITVAGHSLGGTLAEIESGPGVLFSSGLIAGGAIAGIAVAGIAGAKGSADWLADTVGLSHALGAFATSSVVALLMFAGLGVVLHRIGLRRA